MKILPLLVLFLLITFFTITSSFSTFASEGGEVSFQSKTETAICTPTPSEIITTITQTPIPTATGGAVLTPTTTATAAAEITPLATQAAAFIPTPTGVSVVQAVATPTSVPGAAAAVSAGGVSGGGGGAAQQGAQAAGGQSAPQGQVLGAAMAPTGSFITKLMKFSLAIGMSLLLIGYVSYTREKYAY